MVMAASLNVAVTAQDRESWLFIKARPINLHINTNRVITISFPSTEVNKLLLSSLETNTKFSPQIRKLITLRLVYHHQYKPIIQKSGGSVMYTRVIQTMVSGKASVLMGHSSKNLSGLEVGNKDKRAGLFTSQLGNQIGKLTK